MIKIFRVLLFWLLSLLLCSCGAAASFSTPTLESTTPAGLEAMAVTPLTTAVPTPAPSPLPAHVIVLDPGHGGGDWGTFHSSPDGTPDLLEKDITLKMAQQTAELLRSQGYKVFLTREGDYSPNNPPRDLNGDGTIDQIDDLIARINFANQNKADLFLSIHINSSELGNQAGGIETWYCDDRPFAAQSKTLAELVQKETVAVFQANGYQAQDRKVGDDLALDGSGNHIGVLGPVNQDRKVATGMPGVLTEALFITNDTEAGLLRDPGIIKALANSYARAIDAYFHP